MNGRRFSHDLGRAAVLTLAGAVAFWSFSVLWPTVIVVKAVTLGLAALFVVDTVSGARQRSGRVVVPAAWLLAALASWWWVPALGSYVAVQVALLWLVRMCCVHVAMLPAMFDLAVMLFALLAAIATAQHTRSFAVSVWVFALLHAIGARLPQWRGSVNTGAPSTPQARFDRAWHQAEAALRRLRAAA